MRIDHRLRLGLRARLLLLSLSVAVVAVVATAWVTDRATSDRFRDALDDEEFAEAFVREDLTLFAATHTDWAGVDALLASLALEFDQRFALTTVGGSLIADTEPLDAGVAANLPNSATDLIDPANPLFGFNPCSDDGSPAASRAWSNCSSRTSSAARSGSSNASRPRPSPPCSSLASATPAGA